MPTYLAATNQGFFISPACVIVPVTETHIKLIIDHPQKFSMTRRTIQAAYRQHDEPLYTEGLAREDIIKKVLRKGWIRVRRYPGPPMYWTFQFNRMSPQLRDTACRFSRTILKGIGGIRERSRFIEMRLTGFADGYQQRESLSTLAGEANKFLEIARSIEDL